MQNPPQSEPVRDYYSKANFWDERYQSGGYFDWYAEFPELQYAFQTQYGMTKQDYILMVGCGNSKLSQQMYDAGYTNIVNIDISPTVIQQMKQLSPGMQWLVMDATQMTFENNQFDYVIDKGTMDALIAGRDLSPAVKLLRQCMRVTKQEGHLIQITYGSPEGRKKVFQTALPFNLFDYYFAYVNLNDVSTMINLMRNNLIGPNDEKIEKDIALQKSMKDFMLIKFLRAKRSKDKQFVVWENFAKTTPLQIPEKKNEEEKPKQETLSNQSERVQQKNETKEQASEPQENQTIKYQSKPQKQSFVYAYSIKRKFGYDLDSTQIKDISVQKFYEGKLGYTTHFEFKGSESLNKAISLSQSYCTKKQISHGFVDFIGLTENFSEKKETIKLQIQESDSVRINILQKANLQLEIQFTDFNEVSEHLKKLGNYLTEKMGLNFHPCPKTYSLFVVMKGRMKAKTVNQLLTKFWYPTFEFKNINFGEGKASVTLAVPPILPGHFTVVQELINGYFSKSKNLKVQILQKKAGFVTFPELNLLSVINVFSLSHNSGKALEVSMKEFSNDKVSHMPEDPSKYFVVENTCLEVPSKVLPLAVLHLVALY